MLDGVGIGALFNNPSRITMYSEDTAAVTDLENKRVRFVGVFSGAVTTAAGTGAAGAQDGDAATASFRAPT